MDALVREITAPFSRWAEAVKHASATFSDELYDGGGNPFSSTPCIESCCGLLEAVGRFHQGAACCEELLKDGVYRTLGEGIAADWEGISERLAQRADTQAHDPAWLQEDVEECLASVSERLRRACCRSETAVLMLRLAVRAACLAGSWYGPWDSMEAVRQLVRASAWTSLLHALRALLTRFGADLAKQYNATNIVSDVLHVSQALSFAPSPNMA